MSKYEISMEISGPFAMWSRPDTGATPTSYPVPTWHGFLIKKCLTIQLDVRMMNIFLQRRDSLD